MGHQDKSWAPYNTCRASVKNLCQWTREARTQLSFRIPMVWQEKNHVDDCYFCLTKPSGYRKKTWQKLSYPNLDSAIRCASFTRNTSICFHRTAFTGRWRWYMWIRWKSWSSQWYRLCEYINQIMWKLQPGRTQWFNWNIRSFTRVITTFSF